MRGTFRSNVLVECKKCGAPLDVEGNDWVVRCGYCGSTTRVARTRTLAAVTPKDWAPPKTWEPPKNTGLPPQRLRKRTVRAGASTLFRVVFLLLVMAGGVLVPLHSEGIITLPLWDRWTGEPTLAPKVPTRDLDEPPKVATEAEEVAPEPATTMRRETRAHRAGTRAVSRGNAALAAGDLQGAIAALDEAQHALGRRDASVQRLRAQVAARGAREVGLKVVSRCHEAQSIYRALRHVGAERAAEAQFVDGCPRPSL